MLTPAQRHFQRVMAERHGKTEEFTEAARTAHEQILHRLRMDQSALKRVQSDQAKAEMKKQLLPHYEGWIEGTLDGNSGRQDEVIVTLMIWAIDAGDYPLAVRIGRYVIEHNLAMPDQFRRTAATALVEELCDPILVQVKADESTDLTAHLQVLDELAQIVDGKDMPDVVLAKLFKVRGFALRGGDDAAQAKALELLRQALKLDANAGVKKAIESLAHQVKKAGQTTDGAGDNYADTSGAATTDAAAASKTTVPATPRRQRSSTARKSSAAKKPAGKGAGKKATE
ncbi:phage terminase small subunit [Serratia marcescens]|uniref:phage terminase small subunit n=1 Tax=Serratia marcescens TaxID=615 RepID=UPI001BD5999E|nr:phage terminase small subunit [Serratia marcescens]MDV5743110.1 phage terminase small subunit [Serratia marcescens]MDV5748022.1 phage terminase small subunit [Serratia marcescens]MDV5779459.1 phage terminase small subunit [Serratia marcescens]MDV5784400.1 phage terminase small subunit [Serratia marcescens]MDV5831298.1 phage terminase small subunit [Serratia marcescens]